MQVDNISYYTLFCLESDHGTSDPISNADPVTLNSNS